MATRHAQGPTATTQRESLNGWTDQLVRGHMGRRTFLGLASGLSASVLLASCSGGGSGGASGGEKVVPLFTTESDPATLAYYKMVIAKFEKDNPGVTVKVTAYSDEYQLQYLQTAFSTGTDVGVFGPPPSSIADWARAGYLLPITDVVKSIGEDDFLAGTRVTIDSADYAMPFQANASALYYRKDVLDKAGIAAPTTYDQYLSAVKELHGKDGMIGVASVAGGSPQALLQFFTPYVHQAGWDYFAKDGTVRFGEQDVLEGFKRYIAIMRNTSPSMYNGAFGDIVTAYSAGKAAFATFPGRLGVNLADSAPKVADNTGVIGIPAGPFQTGKLHFGGTQHYSIYKKTKHSKEALAFLQALTTGENALAFALTVPGHLLPPLKSVGEQLKGAVASGKTDYLKKHGDWVLTFQDLVPGAMNPSLAMGSVDAATYTEKLSNPCPWANQVWTAPPIDGQMVQQVLIKKVDPEKAWSDAVSKMTKVAKEWRDKNPTWKPAA